MDAMRPHRLRGAARSRRKPAVGDACFRQWATAAFTPVWPARPPTRAAASCRGFASEFDRRKLAVGAAVGATPPLDSIWARLHSDWTISRHLFLVRAHLYSKMREVPRAPRAEEVADVRHVVERHLEILGQVTQLLHSLEADLR